MELTKYDIFIQIVENGSLTKTAQKIGYTQSAISHLVASLEAELGLSLLVRSRSGVSLTPEGEAIFPYIQSIGTSYDNLHEYANNLRGLESGIVRISAPQSVLLNILPLGIAQFQKKYPGVRFEFKTVGISKSFQNVVNGVSDIGFSVVNELFSFDNLERCELLPFSNEKMLVIIPENHPAAELEYFPPEWLQKEKYIMIRDGVSETRPIFKRYKVEPDVLFYVEDATTIMAMVEQGLGISIIPTMSFYRNPFKILAKELPNPFYRKIGVFYKKQPLLSHAAREFLDTVLDISADFCTKF